MVWYDDLYLSDNIKKNIDKYRWKLEHNAGMIDMYLICLSDKSGELLNILSSKEFMKKYLPIQDIIIVGMARGYDNALDIVEAIVWDVYSNTGTCDVRHYFEEQLMQGSK